MIAAEESRVHTATTRRVIPADVASVWRQLTSGEQLAQWFADADDVRAGGTVQFSFGDGDFFVGDVRRWEPPHDLSWSWRFLGVGPTFDIHFALRAVDAHTLVTVTDTGAMSAAEAESLAEGWRDFLERLDAYAATGRRTRYTWSETIAAAAVLPRDADSPRDLLSAAWLRQQFRDADIDAMEGTGDATFTFRDPAWHGVATTARIHATPLADGLHVGVTHSGWPALAPDQRLDERRRYAGLWQRALTQLETARPA